MPCVGSSLIIVNVVVDRGGLSRNRNEGEILVHCKLGKWSQHLAVLEHHLVHVRPKIVQFVGLFSASYEGI